MTCPVCKTNETIRHPVYGILPCENCKARREKNNLPNQQIEFTSESIREERKKYAKSIIAPFRSGEPSREFIEAYPEKAKQYYTKKEMKTAKRVWTDIHSRNTNIKATK